MRLKSALRRGVAAAVIAGIVVSSGIPAYAKTWNIADGDITVKGASDESGNYNNVKQGDKDFEKDTDTVITSKSDKSEESKEHTVTIDTSGGNVDVTFDDLKIDVSGKGEAAVTVKGGGDATIELDGDNELKSGGKNAGLEKNDERSEDGKTISGKLTIKDDKGKDGSLTAAGGAGGGAGIGGKHESGAGNIEITGGTIKAEGGEGAAGIGGGVYGIGHDIEISGGKVSATGGDANENLHSSRPGAAGIGDGAGTEGVGGLSGLTTLSPDSLTTVQQPEQAADPGPEDSIRIPLLEDEEKITIQPFTEKTPAEEQTDTAGPRGQQGRRDDSAQQTEAGPRGAQASRDGDKTGEPRGPRGRHAGRGN